MLNYTLQTPEDFAIVKPAETLTDKDFGTDSDDWIFELPVEYGGTFDSKAAAQAKDNLQTFDISVGAAKAQELFEAAQAQNQEGAQWGQKWYANFYFDFYHKI